jgi:UDP-N-acetyl-D-mannosaminuronic acid dehydrogenase
MSSMEHVGLYGRTASADREDLVEALTSGEVPVAVYGLGKIGLPLAAVYAELTSNTTGVDIDERVVEGVAAGETHVEGEPGLADVVAEQVNCGALSASADLAGAAAAASIHVIIVPTTLTDDQDPDLSAVAAVAEAIGVGLDEGDTVLVECTLPPGTCRDLVEPTLAAASGLSTDEFGVAFCPERTSSGRALQDIRGAYPKVVGGVDPESTRVAELVYGELTDNDVIPVRDATTAEAVKVFEGLYRDVNIALANELARVQADLGIDVREAIDVANTQPFCEIHHPGAGVGGHCIPYYPYFVFDRVDRPMPLCREARATNDSMPAFVAAALADGLEARGTRVEDATVAVLGLAYRAGVAETRASPAKPLVADLRARGADVVVVDPVLEDAPDLDVPLTPLADLEGQRHDLDAVALVTAHPEFAAVDWDAFDSLLFVDGRDALGDVGAHHDVYTIGRGYRTDGERS